MLDPPPPSPSLTDSSVTPTNSSRPPHTQPWHCVCKKKLLMREKKKYKPRKSTNNVTDWKFFGKFNTISAHDKIFDMCKYIWTCLWCLLIASFSNKHPSFSFSFKIFYFCSSLHAFFQSFVIFSIFSFLFFMLSYPTFHFSKFRSNFKFFFIPFFDFTIIFYFSFPFLEKHN